MAGEALVHNNDVGTDTSLVVAVRLRSMKSKRERERLSPEFMIFAKSDRPSDRPFDL